MPDSPTTNHPELTVSELAASLKRTIETNYDQVTVRGELGRVTIAKSGHMYADLKDDKAVLNTIMWRGQVDRLTFRPEEGLEVIATGKLDGNEFAATEVLAKHDETYMPREVADSLKERGEWRPADSDTAAP